ncbi:MULTISPECIES: hypothetical protein [unclassified Dietzia]|uniref:hypothetical protein n=1 Tax=unclassified Dietzia TaxID=2617939 RepID=UPI0015FAE7AE|nr:MULTISPECIES: hypothetical protein [unclassified Dietzia]MBB1023323.1 hypothetical protein [Dietzia sp. DQ12-76]MBB1026498.1 hypothetical protein [Dietzia sp. DQ11-38-2]
MTGDRRPIAGVAMHTHGVEDNQSIPPGFMTTVELTGENRDLLTFYITAHRIGRDELAELLSIAHQALTHENRLETDHNHGGCRG